MARARSVRRAGVAAIVAVAGALVASGQAAGPPADPIPNLDDLLGLPRAEPRAAGAAAPEDEALREKLTDEEEPTEDFERAVELMSTTAQRLSVAGDAGLPTQRMQEDIVRALDKLIAQAEQNQQQSRSKQRQQQQQQQGSQREQRQQSQAQRSEAARGESSENQPPAGQEARPAALSPAAQAAWGNLPQHVREALVQGASDRFSSMYQRLTETYYRRLAEEPREAGGMRP